MRAILSIWLWVAGAVLTVAVFCAMALVTAISFFFDKKRAWAHAQCYWWSDALIKLNPFWKLEVTGLENVDKKATYVIVANHQSLADIIVLYKIRTQFKWVAKESLFSVPVVGWCLGLAKHIRLTRGKFSSIKQVYRDAATWLRAGVSVLFFPEGTRSSTDEMKEFQNGAFKLAIKEKRPVLPVALGGTSAAIQKGSWIFRGKVDCFVRVLPAVSTADLGPADFGSLKEKVYRQLEAAMK